MPDRMRDFDLDDALGHTRFVPDPSFKEALRARLQHARQTGSPPPAQSFNGWRRLLFIRTDDSDDSGKEDTMNNRTRLITVFAGVIGLALMAGLVAAVLLPAGLFGSQPEQGATQEAGPAPVDETQSTTDAPEPAASLPATIEESGPTPTTAPTPTATLAPDEIIVTQLSDLVGVWKLENHPVFEIPLYWQFNADGTYSVDYQIEQEGGLVRVVPAAPGMDFQVRGTFSFEGSQTQLQEDIAAWIDAGFPSPAGLEVGLYEVRLVMAGDKPSRINFLSFTDHSMDRRNIITSGPWRWVGPAAPTGGN